MVRLAVGQIGQVKVFDPLELSLKQISCQVMPPKSVKIGSFFVAV